ncbi:predicted protein [Naegleria gruberi]|uniref:Predicted protein n=1 Tax=Naegleria gruberi TaxID=5762 RepID=D2W267_NAEGR|nr:uncharacterized protein NAEGRDRAFT_54124 [Naegleria gruberi]EFC36770.1 predicted protein [Naegleria gruberi]|eukprot:XP_002669514.1 predicted protein [Naegleria gruberi strain NEG-M]
MTMNNIRRNHHHYYSSQYCWWRESSLTVIFILLLSSLVLLNGPSTLITAQRPGPFNPNNPSGPPSPNFQDDSTQPQGICANGSTTWDQDICTETSELSSLSIRPSYCKNINPYVIPYPFSDHEFSVKLSPDCYDYKTGLNSNDIERAECETVKSISSVEFGPFVLPDLNVTSKRFSLFGMNTGEIYAMDFNTNELFQFENQTSDPIKKLDAFVLGLNNTAAYIISSDGQHSLKVLYFNYLNRETSALCEKITYNESVVDFKSLNVDGQLYLVALTSSSLESSTKYLKFSKMDEYCNIVMNEFTYSIQPPKGSSKISFDIFTQAINNTASYSPSIYTRSSSIPTRNIISVQTEQSVSVINFVTKDLNLDLHSNSTSPYLVFTTNAGSGQHITSSSFITEELRRIDFATNSSTSCSLSEGELRFPSQEVHLLVTLFDGTNSTLIVRNLPEFSAFTLKNLSDMLTNEHPFNRDFACDIAAGYYQSGPNTCVLANEYSIPLEAKATQVHSRFIDIPELIKEYLAQVTTESSKNTEQFRTAVNLLCIVSAGGDPMNPNRPFDPNRYMACVQALTTSMGSVTCQAQAFGALGTENLRQLMNDYLQYNVFITMENNALLVLGVQQRFCDPLSKELIIKPFNKLQLIGRAINTYISGNGQHIFISITRKKWEIESLARYKEICDMLEEDPDNIFLKDYRTSCIKNPAKPININTFGFYLSSCFPGIYCPSLTKNELQAVPDKFYTERPNTLLPCPIGSFCTLGFKRDCITGFVCDKPMMVLPKPCTDNDYNCYASGLAAPFAPSKGTVTLAPYFPTLPIAPGLYIERHSEIDLDIRKCSVGDYCPLARALDVPTFGTENVSILDCPAGTVCSDPFVITPKTCFYNGSYSSYCPTGTSEELPCPAGHYCLGPSSIKECRRTQYCPAGTLIPTACPGGYYCSTPSEKLICPKGHYCPEGTVMPHPCGWLSLCGEGKSNVDFNILGFFFVFICLMLVVGIHSLIKYVRSVSNKKRDLEHQEAAMLEMKEMSGDNTNSKDVRSAYASKNLRQSYGDSKFGVNIAFEDLCLTIEQSGKTTNILSGVRGEIRNSELLAVMGCSGSGKTSFITSLCGKAYYGNVTGTIKLNGNEASLTKFRKLTGFVPQLDIMQSQMTVYETLYFAARTRLDKRKTNEQVDKFVSSLISILGLDDVKHSIIGDEKKRGISGGQKKRVNIGLELAAAPSVLFLDASTSREIIEILRNVAVNQHITVVTVIHQPRYEIFAMFHKVMLLGKGGRVVYCGPSIKAVEYFESIGFKSLPNANPADYIMDVISGNIEREGDPDFKVEDLFTMWEDHRHLYEEDSALLSPSSATSPIIEREDADSVENSELSGPTSVDCSYEVFKKENDNRKISYFTQFMMCLKRCLFQLTRDTSGFVLDVGLVYLAGLSIGVIFYESRYIGPPATEVIDQCPEVMRYKCSLPVNDPIMTMASILGLGLALCGLMSSLSNFGDEITVFIREYESNISPMMYFLAKNLIQIPIIMITPAIFISIFYIISNPQGEVWQ